MKEYIERAAVHELVKRLKKYQMFSYDRTKSMIGISPDDVDFGVDKIPAADVAEVVHGKWEPGNPICPVCGENKFKDLDADVWADWQPKFCPNCGALMREIENGEK